MRKRENKNATDMAMIIMLHLYSNVPGTSGQRRCPILDVQIVKVQIVLHMSRNIIRQSDMIPTHAIE